MNLPKYLEDMLAANAEKRAARRKKVAEDTQARVSSGDIRVDRDASAPVRRAAAYVSKLPGAVSGQNGSSRTSSVACVLARDFALSDADALPIFLEWNYSCDPPWTAGELLAKLEWARSSGHGEIGSKLREDAGRPRPPSAFDREFAGCDFSKLAFAKMKATPTPTAQTPEDIAAAKFAEDDSLDRKYFADYHSQHVNDEPPPAESPILTTDEYRERMAEIAIADPLQRERYKLICDIGNIDDLERADGCGFTSLFAATARLMLAKCRCRRWNGCAACRAANIIHAYDGTACHIEHLDSVWTWRGWMDDAGVIRKAIARSGGKHRQIVQPGGTVIIIANRAFRKGTEVSSIEGLRELRESLLAIPAGAKRPITGSRDWALGRKAPPQGFKFICQAANFGKARQVLIQKYGARQIPRRAPLNGLLKAELFELPGGPFSDKLLHRIATSLFLIGEPDTVNDDSDADTTDGETGHTNGLAKTSSTSGQSNTFEVDCSNST